MRSVDINVFISVEYLYEDGLKGPKHVGGLPRVCISLYRNTMQSLQCI
jgi:hypothetical protein